MKTQNPAKLSIISVNFGSADKIINLYNSIIKFSPRIDWEMIIVDNPTQKGGDGEFLNNHFSRENNIHVIQLAKNLGYGEGNNEGAKFASGNFLAICNPDTEVLAETFDQLLEVISREKKTGIVVPILKTNEGDILENCRNFPTIFSLIKRRLFKKKSFVKNIPISFSQGGSIQKIDWAQGSFWVLRKEIYKNLAGFDTQFFLFMEDIDFCRRLQKTGLNIIQAPEATAIHSPNRLSGGFIGSAIFRKTFWIHLRSAILYFWKWK